jgi:hypothetical protein
MEDLIFGYKKPTTLVETEVSHTSFPIWQNMQTQDDGFFMHVLTFDHANAETLV